MVLGDIETSEWRRGCATGWGDGVPPPYPGCNEIVIIRGFVNCLNPLCEADFMPDVSSASW